MFILGFVCEENKRVEITLINSLYITIFRLFGEQAWSKL